jgi:transposase InsO family protein
MAQGHISLSEDKFEGLEFHHVERDRNAAADALSKLGSSRT